MEAEPRRKGPVHARRPGVRSTLMSEVVVGRDAELASLRDFVASISGGAVGFVLEGEAGMGKTTLWRPPSTTPRSSGSSCCRRNRWRARRRCRSPALATSSTGARHGVGATSDRATEGVVARARRRRRGGGRRLEPRVLASRCWAPSGCSPRSGPVAGRDRRLAMARPRVVGRPRVRRETFSDRAGRPTPVATLGHRERTSE